jgi:glycosyltransferase involved in cell wall biosynthesis
VITLTVAVCTRNRLPRLKECLGSLANLFGIPERFDVLVVDNGSTDATGEFLAEWQQDGPGRTAIVEPLPGLSRARNAALRRSSSDVVLFVDDDALVPTAWAIAHAQEYELDEKVGVAGGPIGLRWPAGCPTWIGPNVRQFFGALDHGDERIRFPTVHGPYGTNMSVRREAALAVGGFDPRLGRVGRNLMSAEEPELTRRLREAGWGAAYAPAAAIVHQISAERISRRWLLRRAWAQGVSSARADQLAGDSNLRAQAGRSFADFKAHAARIRRQSGRTDEQLAALVIAVTKFAATLEYLRPHRPPTSPAR